MRNGEKECEKLYLMLQKDDNERITIMDKDANYEIVLNTEKISYLDFITRLIEIHRECNHEHYLSEVFIPFFSNVLF
jgi:hypothetical protein